MKTGKKILFWSIITSGAIAIFWTIWYLINDQVPITTSLEISESWTYFLPFGISRWWDILIGPLWLTPLILLCNNLLKSTQLRLKEKQGLTAEMMELSLMLVILAAGATIGLLLGICYGLIISLISIIMWLPVIVSDLP
jgi:hypothetical protein